MAKKKFYAVASGRSCGIYLDWATAERQVKGFAGAKFKSFSTRQQAEAWLENPVYQKKTGKASTTTRVPTGVVLPPEAIVVYTDGGSINNPGPGGYGVVIKDREELLELSGGFRLTTNNRMEMMGAIVALGQLEKNGRPIHLFSDSSYLVNGMSKGWALRWRRNGWRKSDGKEVLNADLWSQLLELTAELKVNFHWVKGHAGDPLNERCDRLVQAAAKDAPGDVDTGYEKPAVRL